MTYLESRKAEQTSHPEGVYSDFSKSSHKANATFKDSKTLIATDPTGNHLENGSSSRTLLMHFDTASTLSGPRDMEIKNAGQTEPLRTLGRSLRKERLRGI